MKINDLLKSGESLLRVLAVKDKILVINCKKITMPIWVDISELQKYHVTDNSELKAVENLEELSPADRKVCLYRYTVISPILPFIEDSPRRNSMIEETSKKFEISKQTVRKYLCTYLVYQNIGALAPTLNNSQSDLSKTQKIMRWSLNKFFYTKNNNSLKTAYTMMLKEKYCDDKGMLLQSYPSFYQFRYFYRKTRNMEKFYITRDGLKNYQMNSRPLVDNGVQEFAPNLGTAMLDGTVCDIFLVDGCGKLISRPILVAAIDANSSLCLGYALLWEGGLYSLQKLMLNILENKVSMCERMGIKILKEQWPNSNYLPGVFVSDQGTEYKSNTFEQIAELGITLINLPAYRPELKGPVEKFFDLIQQSYKTVLKNRGVIMPDFQQRGSHDYRKDACLSLNEFEKILVRTIVYYNSKRILKNYPYTEDMINNKIQPYACNIWNSRVNDIGTNIIKCNSKEIILTLFPRTTGKFTRYGLKVNKLRYYADGFKEKYLTGDNCVVSYNPDNCNKVWLCETNGIFKEFNLIEISYSDMTVSEVREFQSKKHKITKEAEEDNYQAKIGMMNFIETVADGKNVKSVDIKGSGKRKTYHKQEVHTDLGVVLNDRN